MQYGVCIDPELAPPLAEAGFDFIELHVQNHLKTTEADDQAFLDELVRIKGAALPATAANCFVPGDLKITGPEVNWTALEAYVKRVFERAQAASVQTIVFGSGGARRIPDGFDREAAWEQLVRFGKLIGPLAAPHDVMVVVEPLNQQECNVLTSVGESGRYVRAVDHPNVRLLVDAYHWGIDDHDFEALVANAELLRHAHIATVDHRLPPGFEPCAFGDFFRALHIGGYDGPISIEAKWDDIAQQAAPAYQALTALAQAAAG